jgi:hypothetical protein
MLSKVWKADKAGASILVQRHIPYSHPTLMTWKGEKATPSVTPLSAPEA